MIFKECSLCKKEWLTRDSFLRDPDIIIIGYQAHFQELEKGLYLFNHERRGCGTTIACYVRDFMDLYSGDFPRESRFQSDECPGFCLDSDNTAACHVNCKNAYPRALMQILKNYK